jgi:putative tryptophan/tyrosine transport system substrate-binding protein
MKRREFVTFLGGAAAWPWTACAQQVGGSHRIGAMISGGENDPDSQARISAFQGELQKLGWIEGRNLRIDRRYSAGDDGRLRDSAAELVNTVPDVIVTNGTQATAILRQLTSTIPIVFTNVADPVASNFVATFAHPAGNITGLTSEEYSLAGKWLSILKDVAPGVTRVLVLYNPDNSNWTGYLRTIDAAAPSLAVKVGSAGVTTSDEIARQVEAFARDPGGGMIVVPSGFASINRETITTLAVHHRLPAMYPYSYFAFGGGLLSYGSNFEDSYRRAAHYVDRILRGAKPGDLPVEAPTRFELVINLKAAKALGLTVPQSLQILADEVIE